MSIRVMSIVWDRPDLDPYERLVLLCLADHSDDNGSCYPSIRRLCTRTGMKERGVQNVLKRLQDRGILSVEIGGGRNATNAYTISVNPAPDAPPALNAPRTKCTTPPHSKTVNPAPDAPKPLRTINEPSVSKARDALMTVLQPKIADAFIAHRKAKRATMTDHAAELIAASLVGHPDPDAVVNESIKNGWTGVFPERFNSPPQAETQIRIRPRPPQELQ